MVQNLDRESHAGGAVVDRYQRQLQLWSIRAQWMITEIMACSNDQFPSIRYETYVSLTVHRNGQRTELSQGLKLLAHHLYSPCPQVCELYVKRKM